MTSWHEFREAFSDKSACKEFGIMRDKIVDWISGGKLVLGKPTFYPRHGVAT